MSIVILIPLLSVLGYYHAAWFGVNPVVHVIMKIVMYSFWKGPVIILIGSVFSIFLFKGIIVPKNTYFLSFILLSIAIMISSKTFVFYSKYISEYLSAIMIGYSILLTLDRKNLLSTILNNRILIKVGILSYSLYIWQQLLISDRAWQPWTLFMSNYHIWILTFIKLAVTFLIAGASYYLVESRFLRIKEKYK